MNVSNAMSNGRIRHPALTVDAHTDYYWGGNVNHLSNSPEFISHLREPKVCDEENPAVDCETPTNQEEQDYQSGDAALQAAAKASITAKAQRWHDRNDRGLSTDLANFISSNGIPRRSAVGARYYHPKLDGRSATGDTHHYPTDILITTRNDARVDPDAADWRRVGGVEYLDIAWIFESSPNVTRTGRHEVGHSSDHHSFGPDDHSPDPSDLMYFKPTNITFRDTSILRLRGWSP